jgi:hypothetical protein
MKPNSSPSLLERGWGEATDKTLSVLYPNPFRKFVNIHFLNPLFAPAKRDSVLIIK